MKICFEQKRRPVLAYVVDRGIHLEGFTPIIGVNQNALQTLAAYLRGPVLIDDHQNHALRRKMNTMMHQTNPTFGQSVEQNKMRFAAIYSLGFIKFCYDEKLLERRPDLCSAIDNLIAALPKSAEEWDQYHVDQKLARVEEITRRAKVLFNLSVK